jgi:hypothetical protein
MLINEILHHQVLILMIQYFTLKYHDMLISLDETISSDVRSFSHLQIL